MLVAKLWMFHETMTLYKCQRKYSFLITQQCRLPQTTGERIGTLYVFAENLNTIVRHFSYLCDLIRESYIAPYCNYTEFLLRVEIELDISHWRAKSIVSGNTCFPLMESDLAGNWYSIIHICIAYCNCFRESFFAKNFLTNMIIG